jgi:hypothetical protein
MKRVRSVRNVVYTTLIRFNQKGVTALENIHGFFKKSTEQPVASSLIVALALDHYCKHLLNAMKNAQAAGDENEVAEALQSLAGGELLRVERLRNAS